MRTERARRFKYQLGQRDPIQHGIDERCDRMSDVGAIAGDYEGVAQWYDSAGRSGKYQVTQANRVLSDGLEVSFHHDFDRQYATRRDLSFGRLVRSGYASPCNVPKARHAATKYGAQCRRLLPLDAKG